MKSQDIINIRYYISLAIILAISLTIGLAADKKRAEDAAGNNHAGQTTLYEAKNNAESDTSEGSIQAPDIKSLINLDGLPYFK